MFFKSFYTETCGGIELQVVQVESKWNSMLKKEEISQKRKNNDITRGDNNKGVEKQ